MESLNKKKPKVFEGQFIRLGRKRAVIARVYPADSMADIEVVYLDDMNRAIAEDVIWENSSWTFKYKGPNGLYADKHSRFSTCVYMLRNSSV